MIAILDILPVLTVFPYALLYYAVLLASCSLALLAVRRTQSARKNTLRSALMVTLVIQLILLTFNLLAYQGFSLIAGIFPLLHRGLNLIASIWLIWAVFYHRKTEQHIIIPWSATAVVILATSLMALWWLQQSLPAFNGSWPDMTWVALTLLTLLISGAAYLMRERDAKVEIAVVLMFAALGFILYLALPNAGALPAAAMVSQLLYYPLLISLAREDKPTPSSLTNKLSTPATLRKPDLSAEMAAAFLNVSVQTDQNKRLDALTHSLGLYLMADLCGILEQKSGQSAALLTHTYDLIRQEHLSPVPFSHSDFPNISEALITLTPLRSNQKTDLADEKQQLMQLIHYNQIGNLMIYPLSSHAGSELFALFCASPYTGRTFTSEDLHQLDVSRQCLEQILEIGLEKEQRQKAAEALRLELSQAENERTRLAEELQNSQSLLAELRSEYLKNKETHTNEVSLWVERQKSLETELESLQEKLHQNEQTASKTSQLSQEKTRLEEAIAQNKHQLNHLRQALEQARALLEGFDDSSQTAQISPAFDSVAILGSPQERMKAISEDLAKRFPEKHLSVQYDPDQDLPQQLSQASEQVLGWLLENAFAVSPEGADISIKLFESQPGWLEIQVSDQKGGLSQENQSSFLTLLDSQVSGVPEGLGDLAALRKAAKLLRQMGGHWWIHSQKDQTIHRVSLPTLSTQETD